jgi:uncharacterized protein
MVKLKSVKENQSAVNGSPKKSSNSEQVLELEKEISKTKYNKRTQFAIGLMKAKLAKLKEKAANRGKGQKKGEGYSVKKSGDATVVLLGFPSVGKSTLLNVLTNARSNVAAYAFTTLTCIPGVMEYMGAKIQILDVPGIVEGAADGTGRGKEVLQIIRTADLVIMLLDVFHPEHYGIILNEVRDTGVRLNQKMPDVKIRKTDKGGVDVGNTVKLTKLDRETIKGIMREMGYINATIVLREDIDADQLIDVIEANKIYTRALIVTNKADIASEEQIKTFTRNINTDLFISAEKGDNIAHLKELIFKKLDFIRLYLKEVGKKPDMDEPLIIRGPCTIRDLCTQLHKDFVLKFKFARVWGRSVKFDGQKILKLEHELKDGDVIELHIK